MSLGTMLRNYLNNLSGITYLVISSLLGLVSISKVVTKLKVGQNKMRQNTKGGPRWVT